jgi:hypothetical protein
VNRSQAALLLGHIAAFDRRTVGETDARAWAKALDDIPLDDDAYDAVARFFGTAPQQRDAQRWIQPHHVRTIRADIRAARINAANLFHNPTPDESPIDFVERRRRQLAAAADGHIPPATVRQALEGGPHPAVRAAIAGAVKLVPPLPTGQPPPYVPEMARRQLGQAVPGFANRRERFPELGVVCPKADCRAWAGKPCKRPSGKPLLENTHEARKVAWRERQVAPDAG